MSEKALNTHPLASPYCLIGCSASPASTSTLEKVGQGQGHKDFVSIQGRSKEESDSTTKKENNIIDLFNENDIEDPSQERSNLNSVERSAEYQYCSDIILNSVEAGRWFDAVCDRKTCRISATMQPHAPSPSSAPSSSSFASTSTSTSSIIHTKSALSSFDAVFNPMPMPLYDSPDEILDWADWLATVCVSSEVRRHIDLCVGGLISIPHKKNAINVRDGVMRGIQIRERERERERNIRESILREKKNKIDRKKISEVVTVDEEEEDDDDDDDADADEDEDEGEDESEENDEEEEEEEEEDEDYAGRRSRTPDALPSRSSSRKRKAAFD